MRFAKDRTKRLILAVEERPMLWDKKHPLARTKDVVEYKWAEVAAIAGLPNEIARDKWKNLKDAYRRQCKKVYTEQDYIPKWLYFDMLHFISPTLEKYLKETCKVPVKQEEDELSDMLQQIPQEPEIQILESDTSKEETSRVEIYPLLNRRSKKDLAEDDEDDEDDDVHFLKSLLPYMRNLTPERKMFVRIRMQEVLYREVFSKNSLSIERV